MTQDKYNELITHLLLANLAETESLRDMFFDYMQERKQPKPTDQQKKYAATIFAERLERKRQALLEQVRLYYEGNIGDIDDLLKRILGTSP